MISFDTNLFVAEARRALHSIVKIRHERVPPRKTLRASRRIIPFGGDENKFSLRFASQLNCGGGGG